MRKQQSDLTEEEKVIVNDYLAKYEPILQNLEKLITDINKRLNGEDTVPEYTASPADIAVSRLKSTMKTLKREVTRVSK